MILVTGGAGFIGSNILAALQERTGGDLAACDWIDDARAPNLAGRRLADVVAPESILGWLENRRLDAVVHMGAVSDTTARDEKLVMGANFDLPCALWAWCVQNNVPLIYASSAATYGDGGQGFSDARIAGLEPLNLYGRSKHRFDLWALEQAQAPPQWAGLKFFNVYGPNEYHKGAQMSVPCALYPRLAAGEPAMLFKSYNPAYPDGGQQRDFVWVGDCVDVVMWLLERGDVNGIYNVGSGVARSFDDLARAMFAAMNVPERIAYVDMPETLRARYQYYTCADLSRLRAAGYARPMTALEDGIGAYVRDYLSAGSRRR